MRSVLLLALCAAASAQDAVAPYPLHLDAGWRATLDGRFDDARTEYAACLAWSADNATVAFHMACLERDAERADEAAKWLARAREWGHADAAFARAEFAHVGACAEALAAFGEPDESPRRELDVRWVAGVGAPVLSPDGLRMVCGGGVLWDLEARVPIALFTENSGYGGARFSRDGARLLTWTREGALDLRDGWTGRTLRRVAPAGTRYTYVDVAGDLERALLAEHTFTARLLDVETGDELRGWAPRGQRFERVALAERRERVVLVSDGTLTLGNTDITEEREVLEIDDVGRGGYALDVREPFALCVAQGERRLVVLDLAEDRELGRLDGVRRACLHPKRPWLVAHHEDGRLVWYDLPGLERRREQEYSAEGLNVLAFDPGGDVLIAGDQLGLTGLSAQRGEPLWTVAERGYTRAVSFDAHGTRMAVDYAGGVLVLDPRTGDELARVERPHDSRSIEVFGERLGGASRADGDVALFDLHDGTPRGRLPGCGVPVRALHLDLQRKRALALDHAGTVSVYDVGRRALLSRFAGGSNARLSDDGELVFAWGGEPGLRVFAVEGGERIAILGAERGVFDQAAWDEACLQAAARDANRNVHVWDVDTGQQLGETFALADGVTSLALDPSGRFLALGTSEPTVFVRSLEDGSPVAELDVEGFFPFGVSTRRLEFAPDGTVLVGTTGDYGTVQCWDTATWGRRWMVDNGGGNAGAIDVAFSRTGELLGAWGMGMERVIDVHSGKTQLDLAGTPAGVLFLDGARVLARGRYGAAVVFEGEQRMFTRAEVAEGTLLVHPCGFLGGEPAALRRAVVSREGTAQPADGYAALLFDPRRATARPELVRPPELPELPRLEYGAGTTRMTTCAGGEVALEVRASGDGLRGVLGEVDGEWLPAGDVEWSDTGIARVTLSRAEGSAPRRVTFRALDRAGLLSAPLRVTVRFARAR